MKIGLNYTNEKIEIYIKGKPNTALIEKFIPKGESFTLVSVDEDTFFVRIGESEPHYNKNIKFMEAC